MQAVDRTTRMLLWVCAASIAGAVLFQFVLGAALPHLPRGTEAKYLERLNLGGMAASFWLFFWGIRHVYCMWRAGRLNAAAAFFERHSLKLLFIYALLLAAWIGVVIFTNPYRSTYNAGDAGYQSQVLSSILEGKGPVTSMYYNTNSFLRANPYFYVSPLVFGSNVTPYLLLTPLYAFHPAPPMHVYAIVLVTLFIGVPGLYCMVRAMGGGGGAALLTAAVFPLLIQVEFTMISFGYFDVAGFAVFPWVFAGLFSRRWWLYWLALLFLALCNLPYAYFVAGIGGVTALFFREWKAGVIGAFIGVAVVVYDGWVNENCLAQLGLLDTVKEGMFSKVVVEGGRGAALGGLAYLLFYALVTAINLGLLPLAGLRKDGKLDWGMAGLLAITFGAILMNIFRPIHGLDFRRAPMIVVPLFAAAAYNFVMLLERDKGKPSAFSRCFVSFAGASVLTVSLWVSMTYPWVGLNPLAKERGISLATVLRPEPQTLEYREMLDEMGALIPREASVALDVETRIFAFLANEPYRWFYPLVPPNVQYYVLWKGAEMLPPPDCELVYDKHGYRVYKNPNGVIPPAGPGGWQVLYRRESPK